MTIVDADRVCHLGKRLCRWLLTAADQVDSHRLELTQEYLSQMIGSRRQGIAEVVSRLQKNGLISGQRGRVILKDREGLKVAACECYQLLKRQVDTFLRAPI